MVGFKFHKKGDLGQDLIVFIHGINSSDKAWENKKNSGFWPDFFSEHQHIDVALFSYNTSKTSADYSISDASRALHNELDVRGCINEYDRIVFICHSMGGVVVRNALVKFKTFFDDVDLVLLLVASPSLGSIYASMLQPFAVILRQRQLGQLIKNNSWLGELNKDFRDFLAYRAKKKKPVKGKEFTEDKSPLGGLPWIPKVVSDFAGATFFEYSLKISSTDHSTIAKLRTEDDIQHATLLKLMGVDRAAAGLQKKTFKKLEVVNSPISSTPYYFQNREGEIRQIGDFFNRNSLGLLLVLGEGGLGKTALIYKFLDSINDEAEIESTVHIDCRGKKINIASDIRGALLKTLSVEIQTEFEQKKHELSIPSQMDFIVERLNEGKRIIVIDNFEDSLNESDAIIDAELVDLFERFKISPSLPIRILITSRRLPESFKEFPPNLFDLLLLKEGLSKEHSLKMLGALTKVDVSNDIEELLFEKTKGIPRAIETIFQKFRFSENKSLVEVLNNTPNENTYRLVEHALLSLSDEDIKILEFVAVFPESMPDNAIAFFHEALQLDISDLDSRKNMLFELKILKRIKNRYHLHPIDRSVVLSQISEEDRSSLVDCGEKYFKLQIPDIDLWAKADDPTEAIAYFNFLIEHDRINEAATLLNQLFPFLSQQGAFNTALVCAQQLLSRAKRDFAIKSALSIICGMHWRMGKIGDALAANERLRSISDDKFRCDVNELIFGENRECTAEENLRKWELLYERMPEELQYDAMDQSVFLDSFAAVNLSCGQLDKALELKREAFEIAKYIEDVDWIEAITHNIGTVYQSMGRFEEAGKYYIDALAMNGESNNALWKANHIDGLGLIKFFNGEFEDASNLFDDALEIYKNIQAQTNAHSTKWNKTKLFIVQNKYDEAYAQAMLLFKEINLYCGLNNEDKLSAYLYTSFYNCKDGALDLLDTIEAGSSLESARLHLLLATRYLKLEDRQSSLLNLHSAISKCDELLKIQCDNFKAVEIKLLSLIGLMKFGESVDVNYISDAVNKFGDKGNRIYWKNFSSEMLLYDVSVISEA